MNETQKQIFKAMVKASHRLSVEELKTIIINDVKLPMLDDIVFAATSRALEEKIGEQETVAFYESI